MSAADTPQPSLPSTVEVVGTSVAADWVRVGHTTEVRVAVFNPGERSNLTLTVTHDSQQVSTHVVTVGADQTRVLVLNVTFDRPTVGPVAVAGVSAGEFAVRARTDTPARTPAQTEAQPGFGFALGLLAVIACLMARAAVRGDD